MKHRSWIFIILFIGIIMAPHCSPQKAGAPLNTANIKSRMILEFGEAAHSEIDKGVDRVAALWQAEDGSAEEFQDFCLQNFISTPQEKAEALATIEKNLEIVRGFSHQISRALSAPIVLDLGDITPLDRIFRRSTPSTNYYQSKLAFYVALNFPKYSLEEKLSQGENWTRQEWAMARLGDMFSERIPEAARAAAEIPMQGWEDYFNRYFIHMDRILTPDLKIIFPEGIRLNCHHGLRDNLKGQFTKPGGLERQRLIYRVMLRIIEQTIPSEMIDGRDFFWEPKSNLLYKQENSQFQQIPGQPEGGSRYGRLLASFRHQRALDPYYPQAPDFISRTFESRQIPEEEVEALILSRSLSKRPD
jgi:hypothetical protein